MIRDVLGIAHRPIAVTDVLCFGPPDTPPADVPDGALHPLRIREGVIDGVADYGNKIGLPTVAGAILYDAGYTTNPLVFAGCVGVAHGWRQHDGPFPGDRVVVLGGRTGRDGIRGATFSSLTMDATTGEVAGRQRADRRSRRREAADRRARRRRAALHGDHRLRGRRPVVGGG